MAISKVEGRVVGDGCCLILMLTILKLLTVVLES